MDFKIKKQFKGFYLEFHDILQVINFPWENLFQEEIFRCEIRIGREIDTEPAQTALVAGGRQMGHVYFASVEVFQFFHGELGRRVCGCTYAEGDKRLLKIHVGGL